MAILIQYINKETFKTEITRKSGILYNEKGQSIRQKENTESECICTKNMDSKTLEAQMEALNGERINTHQNLTIHFVLVEQTNQVTAGITLSDDHTVSLTYRTLYLNTHRVCSSECTQNMQHYHQHAGI